MHSDEGTHLKGFSYWVFKMAFNSIKKQMLTIYKHFLINMTQWKKIKYMIQYINVVKMQQFLGKSSHHTFLYIYNFLYRMHSFFSLQDHQVVAGRVILYKRSNLFLFSQTLAGSSSYAFPKKIQTNTENITTYS